MAGGTSSTLIFSSFRSMFGTPARRASPVARYVLVIVPSLPSRRSGAAVSFSIRLPMLPSPSGCGLGLRAFALSGPPLRSLSLRPNDSQSPPRETLSIGFRILVSPHPAIQATGLLTLTPAGLSPAEHASLRWTHNRTCGFPASGAPTAVAFRHTPCRLHLKAKLVPGSPRLSPASSVLRASLPPHTARPDPRGLPVGDTPPPLGLPVLRSDLLVYMPSPLPRRDRWVRALLPSPTTAAFPDLQAGRLPHYPFSRPAQRSLTLRPAYSPGRLATLYTGGFGDFVAYVPAPIATD